MAVELPDIDHLSWLCRIRCNKEEKARLRRRLESILDYMALLEEVDTRGVPTCTHAIENVANIMREDVVELQGFTREDFFANAPDLIGGMIKIPPITHLEGN